MLVRNEEGQASIVTVGLIAALVSVLLTVGVFFAQARDQHQAQLAADMAAVAGAWLQAYGEDGCSEARRFAELNHASLESCTTRDGDVIVTVSCGRREATARAGPV